ncbi:hypothetical protein AMTR_s00104p00072030 [Amborella trichopoda]|uniref:beta-glucosidase n=1 Tax=Amborella trichopoda TaxID=13333 RepID=W1NYA2_AMBTC|nr:hypothetical protein AMTR_s00104p00072030 [Amborella trichopoda]
MTLAEKIGEITQINRSVATQDVMKNYSIRSVMSGGGTIPKPNATVEDWVNMVNDFKKGALSSRLQIPMIYGVDVVHYHNNVYVATKDPELAKRIGVATTLEVRATGILYVLAPCLAVCRDSRWVRCYESFSENLIYYY